MAPPSKEPLEIAHLLERGGKEIVDVYLYPSSFLNMGMSVSKGDEIDVIGSKVKQERPDLVLAREVEGGMTH